MTTQSEAFKRYLDDCDKNAIVPDIAGAFVFAWQEATAQPVSSHGNAEDLYVEMSKHLNCPHCSGSGHIDDVAHSEQEPIGEVVTAGVIRWKDKYPSLGTKLYTNSPQRTWVGLTDERRIELAILHGWGRETVSATLGISKAIENDLKEKNT